MEEAAVWVTETAAQIAQTLNARAEPSLCVFQQEEGKDPHPQDKIQPGGFTTRPLPVHFTTKMSLVNPFSVFRKDEIGP